MHEEQERVREQRRVETKQRKEQKRQERWDETGYKSSKIVVSPEQKAKLVSKTADDDEEEKEQEEDEGHALVYLNGDVTKPQLSREDEAAIIVNCVDNSGRWGSGGVFSALDRLDAEIGRRYELASQMDDLSLGDVHLEPVGGSGSLFVANVVAQKRERDGSLSPVLLPELEQALVLIACTALDLHASVHLPRIGQRSPKFNWYRTERSLQKTLAAHGIRTLVYYYSQAARQNSSSSLGGGGGGNSSSSSQPTKRVSSSQSMVDHSSMLL